MRMKKISVVALLLVGMLLAAACGGSESPSEPPSTPKASAASIVKGGLLYDKWWKAQDGASEPAGNSPLWSTQSSNTRTGADTWRCKECHGWDYKGVDGAYGGGSHKTGFPGVYNAGMNKSKAQIREALTGGSESRHNFSSALSAASIDSLVDFIAEGLIDESKYIDYTTKKAISPNLNNGKSRYDSVCAACHGSDGKTIDIDGAGVGALANDNPWETLHKIRFGNPGSPMPSAVQTGWSTQDAADVLGYAQTLPE